MKYNKYIIIALMISTVACSSNNSNGLKDSESNVDTSSKTTENIVSYEDNNIQDSTDFSLDAVTGATSKSNESTFNGVITLAPQNLATISSNMGGIVKSTNLLSGRYVNKGEIIAMLENPEFINLQQTYLENYAQEEYMSIEYNRQEKLAQEEAASKKVFQKTKADYLAIKSKKEAIASQLQQLGISPAEIVSNGIKNLLPIRASISGYVGNVDINLGKFVEPGMSICQIINKRKMLVKLTAYEKDLNILKSGIKLSFRASGLGNESFSATIITVGQIVNSDTRSIDVMAIIDNYDDRLNPGMYILANIVK